MVELAFPRRVIYWEEAPRALRGLLDSLGARRVLVVTDRGVSSQPFFREMLEALEGLEVRVYDRVTPEPPVEEAVEASSLARGVDAVVAVGGGSVIDVAKAARLLALRPGLDIGDVAPFNPLGVEYERPLLIAVPTTAGTGSDASYGIVLSREEESGRVKLAVGSPEVVPHATILDPRLPAGAPEGVRRGSMVDALTHAVESLASTASNPFSEALAEKAAATIIVYGARALGGDEEAMAMVHAAATMAGMAFTNSGLGLAHAIAHPLGARLHMHHGTLVGVLLPRVTGLYEAHPEAGERLSRLRRILEAVYGLPERPSLRDHILAFYREIGFPHRLRDHGVDRATLEEALDWVAGEAFHDPDIAFSPVIPDEDTIKQLILESY